MSDADSYVIKWTAPVSGQEFSVDPLTHRQHRIVTIAVRGLFAIADTHDIEKAAEYEKSITGIARSFTYSDDDQAAALDKLHIDEIDQLVAEVIRRSNLDADDGTLDEDYAGKK